MIGDLLKEQRILKGLSRKELAEGICSEKYIYLIEKNERNPSVYILNDLSERLAFDFFPYYGYLEFEKPDLVVQHRQKFDYDVQKGDVFHLKKEAEKASKLNDFQKEPLIYDIKVINLYYKVLVENKVEETISELEKLLAKDDLVIGSIALIHTKVILASAYQKKGDLNSAEKITLRAYEMVKQKKGFDRYNTVAITVLIALITLYFNNEDYEKMLSVSKELRTYQKEKNDYNRIYYVEFYLAFAYLEKNQKEEAKKHFMDGVHSALLFKNAFDIQTIMEFKGFEELSKKLNIDQKYLEQFKEIVKETK